MGWSKALPATCAGLIVGVFLSSAMPTFGQGELPIADSSLAALQTQIEMLTSRLEKLEDTTKGPMTVKGPFVVTDDSGKPVFTATAQGSGGEISITGSGGSATLSADSTAELNLKDSASSSILTTEDGSRLKLDSGNQHLFAGQTDGYMQLTLREGQTSVDLVAQEGSPRIGVFADAKSVLLRASGTVSGLLARNGESPVASLGDPGDGNVSLRIYEKGSAAPAVQVGYHKSGLPGISLWEGNNELVDIEKAESGGSGGAVRIFEGGKQVIKLGTADNKTGLHVKMDDDVVFAGKGADGPEYSLQQGANKVFTVNSPNGDPALSLTKDSSNNWSMRAGGQGVVLEGKAHNMNVELLNGTNLHGVLVNSGDKPQAFIGNGEAGNGMWIYDKTDRPILSANIKDGQPGFRVRDDGGKDVATLAAKDNKEGELKLFDASGETVRMGTTKASGAITLSKTGSPTITLGPTDAKPQPALRAYEDGKIALAAGTLSGARGAVVVYGGGQIAAGMEATEAGNGSVFVRSKGAEVASINSTDKPGEGLAVVRAPNGTAVATLGYGSGGGGNVTTTDPSGSGVFSAGFIGGDGPGTACVLHKGMKCLGVGLTGMEGFH